jgi:TonB family protein
MYFDFEDYRPDFSPVGRAISWREGILLSIIAHLAMIIVVLLAPRFLPDFSNAARARALAQAQQRPPDQTRFVFVQPRRDVTAPKAPERAEASDKDRVARAPERAPNPTNPLPFSRGNTFERVEDQIASGRGKTPEPAAGDPSQAQNSAPVTAPTKLPDTQSALPVPSQTPTQVARNGANGQAAIPGGLLNDALRNLQRSMQNEAFENQGGSGGQFGPEIQFDTKGVEFGPWIRRFIAQVKRNWIIPIAAMTGQQGHVVITFNVHKDGSITDLNVIGPCPVESFNSSAFGALSGSNPTQPLPPEYPSDKAFFTVTFLYNETPPR